MSQWLWQRMTKLVLRRLQSVIYTRNHWREIRLGITVIYLESTEMQLMAIAILIIDILKLFQWSSIIWEVRIHILKCKTLENLMINLCLLIVCNLWAHLLEYSLIISNNQELKNSNIWNRIQWWKKKVLLTREGVYPHDWLCRWFCQMKLPSKSSLYSKLHDEQTSDDDYKHATKCGKYSRIKICVIIMVCISKWSIISWCLWEFQKDLFEILIN